MKLYTLLTVAMMFIVGSAAMSGAANPGRINTYSGEHGNYSINISVDSSIFSEDSILLSTIHFEAIDLGTGSKIHDSISSLFLPNYAGKNTISLTTSKGESYSLLLVNLSQPFQVDTLFKSSLPEMNYWIRDTYQYAYSESTGILAISGWIFGPEEDWPTIAITRISNRSSLDTIRLVNAFYPAIVSDGKSILMATGADLPNGDSTLFGVVLYDIQQDTLYTTPEDDLSRISYKSACTGCSVFYIALDDQEKKLIIMQWQPETDEETELLQWWYPQVLGDYYVTRDTLYYSMRDMSKADTSWQTLSIVLPK